VKRLSADDSAGSRVKVGHRQAITPIRPQLSKSWGRIPLRKRFVDSRLGYRLRRLLCGTSFLP
jgi:hypothetical protein